MVWMDVRRSRRGGRMREDRVDDEPVSDKNDSCFGVPEGEFSEDKSMKNDLESGEDINGSMG